MTKKLLLSLALCLGTAVFALAQTTVKGIVTDEAGEPLIGAGVMVEGTTIGTITGIDGDYTLSVPADAVNLVILLHRPGRSDGRHCRPDGDQCCP